MEEIRKAQEADKMFEDKDYLTKYFSDMRGQIEDDLENIDMYFPVKKTNNNIKMKQEFRTAKYSAMVTTPLAF